MSAQRTFVSVEAEDLDSSNGPAYMHGWSTGYNGNSPNGVYRQSLDLAQTYGWLTAVQVERRVQRYEVGLQQGRHDADNGYDPNEQEAPRNSEATTAAGRAADIIEGQES